MNAEELANIVVGLGIGRKGLPEGSNAYYFHQKRLSGEQFVSDPRVAMALLKQCSEIYIFHCDDGYGVECGPKAEVVTNNDVNRAITEACAMALQS